MGRFRMLCGTLALLGAACRPAENPQQAEQQTAAFKQAAAAAERNYERFTNEGKSDSLVALYTENGRNLPPNAAAVNGRAAVKADEDKNQAVYDFKLKINSENATVSGPLAVESGTYHMEGTPKKTAPKGMPALNEDGKYVAHWHNVNGQWLIAELIWNSNQPSAMPAPEPAKKSTAAKAPARKR
jgi:ketosteroid isomerase-like protein